MKPLLAHAQLVLPTDYLLTALCSLLRYFQASELVQSASGRCRVLSGILLVDLVQYPIDFGACLLILRVILLFLARSTVLPPLKQALLLLRLARHEIFPPSQVGIHPVIGAQHLLRGHVVDFDLWVPRGALVDATPDRFCLALRRLLVMRGRKSQLAGSFRRGSMYGLDFLCHLLGGNSYMGVHQWREVLRGGILAHFFVAQATRVAQRFVAHLIITKSNCD